MKEKIYWAIKHNVIYILLAIMSMIILCAVNYIYSAKTGKVLINFLDWTVFFAITVSLILEKASSLLSNTVLKKLEDPAKLTPDYDTLINKYPLMADGIDFIQYDNQHAERINRACIKRVLKKAGQLLKFPVTCDYEFHQDVISIVDYTEKQYVLPKLIEEHSAELVKSHIASNAYNRLCIRVDQWEEREGCFFVETSRTTYFDSLLTNRAIDYKWSNGMTVREVFLYGPFLPQLKTSVLSNHLGINGFVESFDGWVPFVRRWKDVSIGKRTYGCSMGASMTTEYALAEGPQLTKEGIVESIYRAIKDELDIEKDKLGEIKYGTHIICAYRDFVEGGKPQLLFYVKATQKKEELEKQFLAKVKRQKRKKRNEKLADGDELLWIKKEDFDKIAIVPNGIAYRGKFYQTMPSVSASIIMLLQWEKNHKTKAALPAT